MEYFGNERVAVMFVWILKSISFACVQCGSLTNPFISECACVGVCVCLFV